MISLLMIVIILTIETYESMSINTQSYLPRTFDKRLSTISVDIKDKVSGMGILSVKERLLDDPWR
jgi:hypothetical protein